MATVAFGLLAAAVLSVSLPAARWQHLRVPPWCVLLAASMLAALAAGLIDWRGLLLVGALWGSLGAASRARSRGVRVRAGVFAVVLAVLLGAHLTPGFERLVLAGDLRLSTDSVPMTLRWSIDKGIAGLLLLALWCRISPVRDVPPAVGVGVVYGLATAIVVVGGVAATGAIHLDPKLPAIAPAWAFANLFLTCITEEALFRGVLQQRLDEVLAGRRWGAAVALVGPSLLFGLVHVGGGPVLVLAAAVAGAGYGLAYRRAGIEAAIFAHFTLNAVHFFGFTYPYAAR